MPLLSGVASAKDVPTWGRFMISDCEIVSSRQPTNFSEIGSFLHCMGGLVVIVTRRVAARGG
jgi:hypothetical protein